MDVPGPGVGVRSSDQGCLARGPAQDPCLLTSLARPTQDISPEECVYIHDPTGLNVLRKGCAHYCNQTIQVSLGTGRSLPSDPGHWLLLGSPPGGLGGLPPSELRCLLMVEKVSQRGLAQPLLQTRDQGAAASWTGGQHGSRQTLRCVL